jgi:hypothetical protein
VNVLRGKNEIYQGSLLVLSCLKGFFIFYFFIRKLIIFFFFGCPMEGGCPSPGACWAYPKAGPEASNICRPVKTTAWLGKQFFSSFDGLLEMNWFLFIYLFFEDAWNLSKEEPFGLSSR